MGTRTFLLDRSDFQRAAKVLTKDERRTALEKAYRRSHKEYTACLARQGTLAAEIASVSRELARDVQPELSLKLAGLLAARECHPAVLAETAHDYATALAAWAKATTAAFTQLGNTAAETIDASLTERTNLDRIRNNSRAPEALRAEAWERLQAVIAEDRPHRELRTACERGMQIITHELRQHFGAHVRGAQVNAQDIAAFVARHEARRVAA